MKSKIKNVFNNTASNVTPSFSFMDLGMVGLENLDTEII